MLCKKWGFQYARALGVWSWLSGSNEKGVKPIYRETIGEKPACDSAYR